MAFSFFFRDLPTIELAVDLMIAQSQGQSKVRVWDAGCAKGQEVYTLAIVLAEKMRHFSFQNVRIDATDIEAEFGDIVRNAVYHKKDLERLPPGILEKYFESTDKNDHMRVIEKVRSKVTFHHHDILKLSPITEGLSLIVCKNVLLHFQQSERIQVFKMFHRSLASGGILANENTQKLPAELSGYFEQIQPNCQVYKKLEV